MTDEPDLERAAREVVDENGIILYHENIAPGLNGFWVEAKDFRVGDVFLGANGELSMLANAVRVEQSGGIAVFNFTVEGNHNYFILAKEFENGQTCVLVHNGDCYVYWAKDKNGNVTYVGITNDFGRRSAEHLAATKGARDIKRIDFKNNGQLTREEARSIEQVLIELFGLRKKGGILDNIRNSIAPKHHGDAVWKDLLSRARNLVGGLGLK